MRWYWTKNLPCDSQNCHPGCFSHHSERFSWIISLTHGFVWQSMHGEHMAQYGTIGNPKLGSFHLLWKTMYDSMIFFRHSSLDFPETPKHDNERIVTTGMGDHLGSKKSSKNHNLHSNRLTPPRTVFIKGGLLGSVLAVRFVFTIVSSHSWKKGTNWIESFEKAGARKVQHL